MGDRSQPIKFPALSLFFFFPLFFLPLGSSIRKCSLRYSKRERENDFCLYNSGRSRLSAGPGKGWELRIEAGGSWERGDPKEVAWTGGFPILPQSSPKEGARDQGQDRMYSCQAEGRPRPQARPRKRSLMFPVRVGISSTSLDTSQCP